MGLRAHARRLFRRYAMSMKAVLAAVLLAPRPSAPLVGRAAPALAPALSAASSPVGVLAAAASSPSAPEPPPPPPATPSDDDMRAALEAQGAYLRPIAAKTGMNITVLSMVASMFDWSPSLKELLDYGRRLRELRAEPGEAERAVAESVSRAKLRRDEAGRPNRDDLENLLMQNSDPASALEISRNGFFLEVERAVLGGRARGWAPDFSRAEWTAYDERVVVFLGRAHDGPRGERPLAFTLARFPDQPGQASGRVRRLAAWPGLSEPSRAAVSRVADELAAAGW